jgi:solute carrier family 15 (peptide/histidine transporter), member 3/4
LFNARTPGVGFSEGMVFSAIATNLVTYLTTVLHESKVDAAKNISAWSGVCFLTPLLGAFVADSYLGRYWTIVVVLPVYIVVSSSEQQMVEYCCN